MNSKKGYIYRLKLSENMIKQGYKEFDKMPFPKYKKAYNFVCEKWGSSVLGTPLGLKIQIMRKTKTVDKISREACQSYVIGKRSFVDVFSDWLLEKGIEVDEDTYEKISELHWDFYKGKGMFYNSGRYHDVGYHQLGEVILKELKIEIKSDRWEDCR